MKIASKKRNKKPTNEQVLAALDRKIAKTEKLLDSAMEKFMEMEPTDVAWIGTGKFDKNGKEIVENKLVYETQAKVVDTLEKDLALLIEKRESIIHPRIDVNSLSWYQKLNWTELIKATGICTAAAGQMYMMYKLQTEGVLFGRDVAKIQFPRP